MSFVVPNSFMPGTLADANAVNANFAYVDEALNTLEGMIGSGLPGFFVSTMTNANTPAANTTALQNDILALIAQGGGTYLLPYGNCSIAGPVYIGSPITTSGTYAPIRIQGSGNNSTIIQTTNTDVFQVNSTTSGGLDGTGVDFFNFRILYNGGLTSGAAIRAVSGQEIRIDKIWFDDCPVAIAADNAAQMSIFRCLGTYANNTSPPNLAMVTIGTALPGGSEAAVEVYMAACTWRTTPANSGGAGGLGVALFGIEHFRMMNCRVEAFVQGVSIIPSTVGKQAQKIHLENVSCFTASATTGAGAGFFIQPQSGQDVLELCMINCETTPGASSGTVYTGAGIVFDASLGGTIDTVKLVSCYSANWNGPGMQFSSGLGTIENVEILGGSYICNGQTATAGTPQGAAIYFHGTALGVLQTVNVIGVTLNNTSSIYAGRQKYSVAMDGGADFIMVDNCQVDGQISGVAYTNGTVLHFYIRNCRGYNNLNTLVKQGYPPSGFPTGTNFDGTNIGTTPYYGPIVVYYSGGTVTNTGMTHDRTGLGFTIGQTSGMCYITSGQSMYLNYSVAPTSFTVFGV